MKRDRALLVAATGVAVVATAGSLSFSEVLGLVPCELCWFQRVLMYPLVVVLGVAAWEDRPDVWHTVLPLSALGTVVAAFHSYVQLVPSAGTCSPTAGCSAIQYPMLGGLLTIPRLSFVAFLLLTAAMVALAVRGPREVRRLQR